MIVQQLVPHSESVELSSVLNSIAEAPCLSPFSNELTAMFDGLSAALFSDPEAKRFPELQALAFFIRRSAIRSLRKGFIENGERPELVRIPCGKVFHLAPGNVDTLFVYSWFLSAITGNTNIVRLSQRSSQPATIICRLLNQVLSGFGDELKRSVSMISYGHDDEITSLISQSIDLRVIWGGDRSVDAIRTASLPVRARELVFPDRYSVALISSSAFLDLNNDGKLRLLHDFFNDSYWFDQAACSSPRQIFFLGDQKTNTEAADQFQQHLQEELMRRDFQLEAGAAVEKLTDVYDCLLQVPVSKLHYSTNELAVLDLAVAAPDRQSSLPEKHASRGSFYTSSISTFDELIPVLTRKVQTLTYFGFERDDLKEFAKTINGRGIDRMVPIGQALSFDRFWDGLDLLSEFTRLVHIK